MTRMIRTWLTAVFVVILAGSAFAAATTEKKTVDGQEFLVVQSGHVKMTVYPAAGGAITELVNLKTGTDFSTPGVKPGRSGYGWKDTVRPSYGGADGSVFAALPYQCEFRAGEGYHAVFAACDNDGLRIEREMRLYDAVPRLEVIDRTINIDKVPRRLWVRWHPYARLGDPKAETSAMYFHGDQPDGVRKILVGQGWDGWFRNRAGYYLAANWGSGEGYFANISTNMTWITTWTDYNFDSKSPKREYFTIEPFPQPEMSPPGQAMEAKISYFFFSKDTATQDFPLDIVETPYRAEAGKFVARVRPHMEALAKYTMNPEGGATNRFSFSHKRRDRMGVFDWGWLDGMFAIGGAQDIPVRARFYAHLFETQTAPLDLRYKVTLKNELGATVKEVVKSFKVDPAQSRELDQQENLAINDLPDGWYDVRLEAFIGNETTPAHVYELHRRLAGTSKVAATKARQAESQDFLASERPFVKALRELKLPTGADGKVIVPIGVEEASGIARKNWPLRVGVPFTQGALKGPIKVAIAGTDQKPLPVQTQVMSTWLDGSVKWALVDFLADVPANQHVFFMLTAERGETKAGAIGTDGGDKIVIDTGAAKHEIAKKGDQILGLFKAEDLWYQTGDGRKYQFKIVGDESGVDLLDNGPVRAVVRVRGHYVNDKNEQMALGELHAEFYAGQKFWRLFNNVTYLGNIYRDTMGGYGMTWPIPPVKMDQDAFAEVDGKVVQGANALAVFQVGESAARINSDGKDQASGKRSGGAVRVGAADAKGEQGFTVYQRDMWRLYPKKVSIDPQQAIRLEFWPVEAGAFSYVQKEDTYIPSSVTAEASAVGSGRTHELIIDPDGQWALPQYEAVFGEPVVTIVPPKYLVATGTMMQLQAYDPIKSPQLEQVVSTMIDSYILQRDVWGWYGHFMYGTMPNLYSAPEQRWYDFGRYGQIINEQDICQTPWLGYMRSGDRKYLKFAEAQTHHLMEVATIRAHPTFPESVGMSRRHHENPWQGNADSGHSMLDPFVEMYHVTGYRPAWDSALRMAEGMKNIAFGTWRYISNPTGGLSRMYLETQRPDYKEQADRVWKDLCAPDRNDWYGGDHANRMVMYYRLLNPECWKIVLDTALEKKRFDGLDALALLYKETGDVRYAQLAASKFPIMVRDLGTANQEDPLRLNASTITQYNLSMAREMMYAGEVVAAGVKAGPLPNAPAAPAAAPAMSP